MPSDPFHSQWRLNFGKEIVQRMQLPLQQQLPLRQQLDPSNLRAVLAGGSAARGFADEYSDLELFLFWETPPSDAERFAIRDALHAEFLLPFNGPAMEDDLRVGGLQMDLMHNTVAAEDAVLERVRREARMDDSDSNFFDTLRSGVPLMGAEILARWQALAADYPDALAVFCIEETLRSLPLKQLRLAARRDNPTELAMQISQIQRQVFRILLALNRLYFPTFKWLYPTLERMPVKPERCAERLRSAFTLAPEPAAAETLALAADTLDLVQARFPQVDLAPARKMLTHDRTRHTTPLHLEGLDHER